MFQIYMFQLSTTGEQSYKNTGLEIITWWIKTFCFLNFLLEGRALGGEGEGGGGGGGYHTQFAFIVI